MSIPINNLIQYCYHLNVENNLVTNWFITKYLDWQRSNQALNSMAEFARYLEVGDKALNTWVNGRNNPSYRKAVQISQKLNDFTLLDLLGYPRPAIHSESISLESLSDELRSRLKSALLEIRETVNEKSLDPESSEAKTISEEVLKKHGFIVKTND